MGKDFKDLLAEIEAEQAAEQARVDKMSPDERKAHDDAKALEAAKRDQEAAQEREELLDIVNSWVEDLPENDVVGWNTHHLSLASPYATGWVDVYCQSLAEIAHLNWCWTIETDEGKAEDFTDQDLCFAIPFDAQLEILPNPKTGQKDHYGRDKDYYGVPKSVRLRLDDGQVLDLNHLLDDAEWASYRVSHDQDLEDPEWQWQRDISWASSQNVEDTVYTNEKGEKEHYKAHSEFKTIDGEQWIISRVWTPTAISKGLDKWIKARGRDDVRFEWEPDGAMSPAFETAVKRYAEYTDQKVGRITVAPGVKVSSSVFDWLLTLDPDESADFIKGLREQEQDEEKRFDAWFDALTEQGREDYLSGDLEPPDDL